MTVLVSLGGVKSQSNELKAMNMGNQCNEKSKKQFAVSFCSLRNSIEVQKLAGNFFSL